MKRFVPLILCAIVATTADAQEDRLSELERKVEALTGEIESLKLGGAADSARVAGGFGLGPGASKVYGAARGVSIGGYGEMLYENFDREREDDSPSGALDRLDYLRQVIYLGYKFNDEVLFNSEIELEHAGVRDEAAVEGQADLLTGAVEGDAELSGEVVLEFAYLDWSPSPAWGVRGGMLLLPVGLVNELHEPPVFLGARRPEVEQRILPTTWRANGVGLFGKLANGLSYRAYLTEGLDAAGFSAATAIRGGRQSGSQSLITQPAFSARLDYTGIPGLLVGAAGFTGDSWQDFQPTGADLHPRVSVFDLHARVQWEGLEARALFASGTLQDAGELSDALGLLGSSRLGERFWGRYVEVAFDVLPVAYAGTRYGLLPYLRYEQLDTQDDVPGGSENPANERTVLTAGAAFKPHPNVVVKADRQMRSNAADTETSQWNVALGYWF